ncbi:MAG: FkbM family methyltransferase [Promethearchaeota archaeon]
MRLKRSNRKTPLLWFLYHPYEGLWNWNLLRLIRKFIPTEKITKFITRTIICLDTLILIIRAIVRRLTKIGFLKALFFNVKVPNDISIIYFDLGTHMEAEELALMVNKILPRMCNSYKAYGFEADPNIFKHVQAKFAGNKNINLIHAALCYTIPQNGKIKLYKDIDVSGGSIYKTHTSDFEEVLAIKITDWIKEKNFNIENNIFLLRMNIEGAEYDVIKDLVDNGFIDKIDGYYGMWDDVAKITIKRGAKFYTFLRTRNIFPFTFNGRDFPYSLRLKCIEYDIRTSVKAALERIKN